MSTPPPRVALVTGAGSPDGIGFHSARILAESGVNVLLTGHSDRVQDRATELRDAGLLASSHPADLTDSDAVSRLASWVQVTTGRLDALVANHGMTSVHNPMENTGESGSIDTTSADQFRSSLERNLVSAFQLTKSLLPLIRLSPSGRVVFVSSVTGGTMAMRHEVSYASAKAGLEGLMRALALDEAQNGVLVNAVAPGWIATGSQTPHESLQGKTVPLGRSGLPEEVASTVAWLAGESARYLTGRVLVVDGGNSIQEEREVRDARNPT